MASAAWIQPGDRPTVFEYAGDADNAATSSAVIVTVGQAAPTISVSASDATPTLGASVTFKDGATTLGTGMLSGTTATYSTAALSVGAHSITAEYAGDADNAAATSSAVTVTVEPAVIFTFSPASGEQFEAMAGEDNSQALSPTGGTGTLTYSLASGSLPKGMALNGSTGELTDLWPTMPM